MLSINKFNKFVRNNEAPLEVATELLNLGSFDTIRQMLLFDTVLIWINDNKIYYRGYFLDGIYDTSAIPTNTAVVYQPTNPTIQNIMRLLMLIYH